MKALVTGGLGIIGAEVVHQLVERGDDVTIVDIAENSDRISTVRHRVRLCRVDISEREALQSVFSESEPQQVYHLAAVLGDVSEREPQLSFQTNVVGTRNVFEMARLTKVEQVLFASSTGTFGASHGEVYTDDSLQRPGIVYGCEKLYGEGLVTWYSSRYGLDFRGLRYAQIVGPNARLCWVWASGMIEDAFRSGQHKATFANPDSGSGFLYVRDAARAAIELLAASKNRVKGTYNLNGLPGLVFASGLEQALRKRVPSLEVAYAGPPAGRSGFRGYDDTRAQVDWNWQPEWSTLDSVLDQFESDLRKSPERFGIFTNKGHL